MYARETRNKVKCKQTKKRKSLIYKTLRHLFKKEKLKSLAVLILFIICIIVLIVFVAIQVNVFYSDNYALVVDAGSTGTRAYLYQWLDAAGVINDEVYEKLSCKTGRLQDVFRNTTNNELLNCISKLLDTIKSSFTNKPYIYLAATAGMRIMEAENKTITKKLFFEIKKEFYKRGWNFQFVGIITGENEAVSAWITTNYLKNTIGKNSTKRSDKFKTVGALDLGGASTQIALQSPDKNTYLDIFNKRYPLYAKSYLCYGTNMFRLKYFTEVVTNPQESEFNCFLEGTTLEIGEDSYTCRSDLAKNTISFKTSKFIKPDSGKCRNQIRRMLTPIIERRTIEKDMVFVAVSSFYYYKSFLKKYYATTDTYESFVTGTDHFCSENIKDLPTKFPDVAKYITYYCMVGNYILTLFDFYGFDQESFRNIIFAEKIQNLSVGWTLGYMIDKTRLIPNSLFFRINSVLFVVIVTLCSVIILFVLLVFLFKMWEKRRKVSNITV